MGQPPPRRLEGAPQPRSRERERHRHGDHGYQVGQVSVLHAADVVTQPALQDAFGHQLDHVSADWALGHQAYLRIEYFGERCDPRCIVARVYATACNIWTTLAFILANWVVRILGTVMDPDPTPDQTKALMRQLARERTRRGLTQAEVARRMGTSQSYLAKLEA